jgi:hypothetical protein
MTRRTRLHLALEPLEERRLLATCNVSRLADIGAGGTMGSVSRGDIRFCINYANSNPGHDNILLHAIGTINLTSALPDISDDVTIRGPGADKLTIRRNTGGDYRIFTILAGVNAEIYSVTLSNGKPPGAGPDGGGAIRNDGSLTLGMSTITGNNVDVPLAYGGGIHNAGVMTVFDSTISNNSVAGIGAVRGGGLYNSGTLIVLNSTVSQNSGTNNNPPGAASVRGGGIYNEDPGILFISNSTITQNSVTNSTPDPAEGGGIGGNGNFNYMRNTIVADNAADFAPDVSGIVQSSGYNLVGDSEGGSGFVATDILDAEADLGPLQFNGGPTQTHALLPGSPAIDAGDNTDAPEFDQRGPGFPRIVNGTIDIGAFEVQASVGGFVPGPTFVTHPGVLPAVTDLNGDGDPDLVIPGAGVNYPTVKVHLGSADTGFQPAVSYWGGGGNSAVAAHADSDGITDVLIFGENPNGRDFIGVLNGKGDGTFEKLPELPPINGELRVADMDDDGIEDLVGANSNGIQIVFGNGDATFSAPVNLPGSGGDPIVADLNADGILDIAVCHFWFGVMRGLGGGSFAPMVDQELNGYCVAMEAGDFNEDNLLDFAVLTHLSTDNIAVFLNQGNGSFTPLALQSSDERMISGAAGDFNSDGLADLAVGTQSGRDLGILIGNGNGTFMPVEYTDAGDSLYDLTSVEINEDGRLDLIASDGSTFRIQLGNGDGTFQTGVVYETADDVDGFNFADFDADGNIDIVTGDQIVTVYRGNGDGTFGNPKHYLTGATGTTSAAVGDFDSDGDVDVIAMSRMLINNGGDLAANRAYPFGVTTDPRTVATADLNGDGLTDFAVGSFGNPPQYSGRVDLFLTGSDGSYTRTATFVIGAPTSVIAADFNGDGAIDLAATNLSGGTVRVFLGNGDGTFQSPFNIAAGTLPYGITSGDFDGDTHLDLAVTRWDPSNPPGPGTVRVMLGNGDGSFGPPASFSVGSNPIAVIAADFNDDGTLDLATANEGDATVSVLIGGGDGTFYSASHYSVGGYPQILFAADFNGDGLPDLAVQSGNPNIGSPGILTTLINTAQWPPLPIGVGSNPVIPIMPENRPTNTVAKLRSYLKDVPQNRNIEALASDSNPADPPEWDQRGPGFPRIVNGRIDIGSFEVQASGAPQAGLDFVLLLTAKLFNDD